MIPALVIVIMVQYSWGNTSTGIIPRSIAFLDLTVFDETCIEANATVYAGQDNSSISSIFATVSNITCLPSLCSIDEITPSISVITTCTCSTVTNTVSIGDPRQSPTLTTENTSSDIIYYTILGILLIISTILNIFLISTVVIMRRRKSKTLSITNDGQNIRNTYQSYTQELYNTMSEVDNNMEGAEIPSYASVPPPQQLYHTTSHSNSRLMTAAGMDTIPSQYAELTIPHHGGNKQPSRHDDSSTEPPPLTDEDIVETTSGHLGPPEPPPPLPPPYSKDIAYEESSAAIVKMIKDKEGTEESQVSYEMVSIEHGAKPQQDHEEGQDGRHQPNERQGTNEYDEIATAGQLHSRIRLI